MSRVKQWLKNELESVELRSPEGKLEEGETVIGELTSPELRRLFSVMEKLREEGRALSLRAMRTIGAVAATVVVPPTGQRAELEQAEKVRDALRQFNIEAAQLNEKVRLVQDLFWLGVKMEFSEHAAAIYGPQSGGIGLNEGWQVVTLPQSAAQVVVAIPCMHA